MLLVVLVVALLHLVHILLVLVAQLVVVGLTTQVTVAAVALPMPKLMMVMSPAVALAT